jgi:hypothetical protein
MQVLHMMAVENRYHVYVTALSTLYIGLISRLSSANVTLTPGTTSQAHELEQTKQSGRNHSRRDDVWNSYRGVGGSFHLVVISETGKGGDSSVEHFQANSVNCAGVC